MKIFVCILSEKQIFCISVTTILIATTLLPLWNAKNTRTFCNDTVMNIQLTPTVTYIMTCWLISRSSDKKTRQFVSLTFPDRNSAKNMLGAIHNENFVEESLSFCLSFISNMLYV